MQLTLFSWQLLTPYSVNRTIGGFYLVRFFSRKSVSFCLRLVWPRKDNLRCFLFIPLGRRGEFNSQHILFFRLWLTKGLQGAIALYSGLCKFVVIIQVTMIPYWALLTTPFLFLRCGLMLVHRYFSLMQSAWGAWQLWEVTTTIITTATGNIFYTLLLRLVSVMEMST